MELRECKNGDTVDIGIIGNDIEYDYIDFIISPECIEGEFDMHKIDGVQSWKRIKTAWDIPHAWIVLYIKDSEIVYSEAAYPRNRTLFCIDDVYYDGVHPGSEFIIYPNRTVFECVIFNEEIVYVLL